MTRTVAREIAIHLIYQMGFGDGNAENFLGEALTRENFASFAEEEPLYQEFPDDKQLSYITELVKGSYSHGPELDDYISRYAIGWSFGRIPRVAVAIMRAAMYEILYMPDIPNASAINEAVEIAKRYVDGDVVSFINGILGTFVRTEFPETLPREAAQPDGPEQEQA
jgi:N utilization substance protein B